MRPLMTANDVTRRLAAGEDALELSIEKWEILVERWSGEADIRGDLDNDAIGSSTCGLCQDNNAVGWWCSGEVCDECLYTLHYGSNCCELHYKNVEDVTNGYEMGFSSREDVVRAAQAMVDSLKDIRENGENGENNE